jgi:hypothetical protein
MESLRSINYNGQNSLNPKSKIALNLFRNKNGLKKLSKNKQFSSPQAGTMTPLFQEWLMKDLPLATNPKGYTPNFARGFFHGVGM